MSASVRCSSFRKSIVFILFFTFILCIISSNTALAGVIIFDAATASGKSIKLAALTKGRFFPEGGKLVSFYVDGKHVGTNLSGGDGYTFLKFTPAASGLMKVRAESGKEKDEGSLLVTGKKDRVILVEIESTLIENILKQQPVKEGKEALETLSKSFRIIYVSSLIGAGPSRTWLRKNEFPVSPVFKWEGAGTLDDLREQGIPIYALIGSPELISGTVDIEKKFSFKETKEGTEVDDWNDLVNALAQEKDKQGKR